MMVRPDTDSACELQSVPSVSRKINSTTAVQGCDKHHSKRGEKGFEFMVKVNLLICEVLEVLGSFLQEEAFER